VRRCVELGESRRMYAHPTYALVLHMDADQGSAFRDRCSIKINPNSSSSCKARHFCHRETRYLLRAPFAKLIAPQERCHRSRAAPAAQWHRGYDQGRPDWLGFELGKDQPANPSIRLSVA
jgi:hypothetical protein